MKVLMVDPGAGTSTIDIHNGYADALRRAGHEVKIYSLNRRIDAVGGYLHYAYRKAKRQGAAVPKPTPMDVLYWAGMFSIEMALRLQPDWLFVVSGMYLLKDTMALLRKATRSSMKMALILTESPYDDGSQAQCVPYFDAVFTNERLSVEALRRFNPNTHYLPHAYDLERHRPDLPLEGDWPSHDVVFVGSGYPERIELLSAVDWTGIDLGLYGSWTLVGSRSKLRPFVHADLLHNREAVQLYRRAKIGLNLHRARVGFGRHNPTIAEGAAESLNARAYELAACGVYQLSDVRAELDDVFRGSVVSFDDAAELERFTRLSLGNDDARRQSAESARRLVARHSYDARVQLLLGVLEGQRAAA